MGTTCSLCSSLHVVELPSLSNEQRHHQHQKQQKQQQNRFQQHQNHPYQQNQNHYSINHHPTQTTDIPFFLDHHRKQNPSRGQYHLLYKKGKEPINFMKESNQKEPFPSTVTVTKLIQRRVKSDGGGMGTHIYAVRYPAPEQRQRLPQPSTREQQEALVTTETITTPSWDPTKDPYVPLSMATPPKVPGMLNLLNIDHSPIKYCFYMHLLNDSFSSLDIMLLIYLLAY